MSNPNADDRIQKPPTPAPAPRPGELGPEPPGRDRIVAGMLFGAYVGLLMGPTVGAVSCWLTDWYEGRWPAIYVGAGLGVLGGGLIGLRERKARGPLTRPDVATITCVAFGLLPAPLVALGGVALIGGTATGLFCIGSVFIGPAAGLMLGAILDRGYEAFLRRAWFTGLVELAVGTAQCIGIVIAVFDAPYGPEPQEIARDIRIAIFRAWKAQPGLDAKLGDLTVERKHGREYTGTMDMTINGRHERYRLEIVVDGGFFTWTTHPLPD